MARPKETAVDVTEGVIWKQLFTLCIPIFFSSFFQQAYTLINTFVVGQFGGKDALGGIQATTCLTELVVGFASASVLAVPFAPDSFWAKR